METNDTFSQLIALYRDLKCPALKGTSFSANVVNSSTVIKLLNSLWSVRKFDIEITIEGNIYDSNDDKLPDLVENQNLSINVTVHQNEHGFIYQNVSDWIARAGALKKGVISPHIYLIDEDTIVTGDSKNSNVAKVLTACQLVNKLSELAHYHDEKNGGTNAYRLVFVMPDKNDKIYHPVILTTQLSNEILKAELPDISILSLILEQQHSINNIHANERISVFRIALADIIEKIPNNTEPFIYLVKNWPEVTDSFNKSWESYLSGFSFSKLKAEIAEQQIIFSQKLTDIVANLSGRLFSLPISIAAIVILERANSSIANWFYLLSCVLVSYMVASAISIQRENLKNAESSYKMAFSRFKKEGNVRHNSIQAELENTIACLDETISQLKGKLLFYSILAWMPLLVGAFYIFLKSDSLFCLILSYVKFLLETITSLFA